MQNILTKNQLLEAQKAFKCEDWKFYIQEILDSTIKNDILIEIKYLDLIKQKATWEQILFCKALNVDLKMNLPEEATEWVLEKIKACEVIKYVEFETFYKEDGRTLFYLNSEFKVFWVEYFEIDIFLKFKYSLKINEIKYLMLSILEEHLKLKDYTII